MPKLSTEEILRRGDSNDFVIRPMTKAEVEAIQLSIRRGRPYGSKIRTRSTAERLGLEFSLRSPGGQPRPTLAQSL